MKINPTQAAEQNYKITPPTEEKFKANAKGKVREKIVK